MPACFRRPPVVLVTVAVAVGGVWFAIYNSRAANTDVPSADQHAVKVHGDGDSGGRGDKDEVDVVVVSSMEPSVHALSKIRRCLELPVDSQLAVQMADASFEVPFLGIPQYRVITCSHTLRLPGHEDPLPVHAIFSESGDLLRVESVTKFHDPWRKPINVVEHYMRGSGRVIERLGANDEIRLGVFWERACERYDMRGLREMNLMVVWMTLDGIEARPFVIMNLWGINNPLVIPHAAPADLKNRVQVIFDVRGGIVSANNVL